MGSIWATYVALALPFVLSRTKSLVNMIGTGHPGGRGATPVGKVGGVHMCEERDNVSTQSHSRALTHTNMTVIVTCIKKRANKAFSAERGTIPDATVVAVSTALIF